MAKQINLIVNSCGECIYSYVECGQGEIVMFCKKNIDIELCKDNIHPDCPLEDVKEEKHCKDCKYCENDICWAETCEKFKAK